MLRILLFILASIQSLAFADSLGFLRQEAPWNKHPLVLSQDPNSDMIRKFMDGMRDPYHVSFFFLLPETYVFYSNYLHPQAQELVDDLFKEILKSPTAQRICSMATSGNATLLRQFYGVSEKWVQSVGQSCPSSKVGIQAFRTRRNREFIFVVTPDEPVVEAWTNNLNVTQIYLKPQEISRERLLRLLIHEMAVGLDQKESFGQMGMFQVGPSRILYSGANRCKLQMSLRKPSVKYAMSSLRAEVVEDKVLAELGYTSRTVSPEKTCSQKVLDRSLSLLPLSRSLLKSEELHNAVFDSCEDADAIPKSIVDWSPLEAIQIIQNEKLISEQGKEVSVCDYMTEPSLGISSSLSPTNGGPRPRIGPGWGSDQKTQDAILIKKDPVLTLKMMENIKKVEAEPLNLPGLEANKSKILKELLMEAQGNSHSPKDPMHERH